MKGRADETTAARPKAARVDSCMGRSEMVDTTTFWQPTRGRLPASHATHDSVSVVDTSCLRTTLTPLHEWRKVFLKVLWFVVVNLS